MAYGLWLSILVACGVALCPAGLWSSVLVVWPVALYPGGLWPLSRLHVASVPVACGVAPVLAACGLCPGHM